MSGEKSATWKSLNVPPAEHAIPSNNFNELFSVSRAKTFSQFFVRACARISARPDLPRPDSPSIRIEALHCALFTFEKE